MKPTFSALIPFYNEGERLLHVIRELKKVPELSKIICVDDGSTDNTASLLRANCPEVPLISSASNLGKTDAVRLGSTHLRSEFTLLFDADLREFSADEISTGVKLCARSPNVDHVLFRQENDPLYLKILKLDLLVTGERIIRTHYLQQALHSQTHSGYELELLLNDFSLSHKLTSAYVPLHARNYLKLQKWGWQTSLRKSAGMYRVLFSTAYLRQLALFSPPPLV